LIIIVDKFGLIMLNLYLFYWRRNW